MKERNCQLRILYPAKLSGMKICFQRNVEGTPSDKREINLSENKFGISKIKKK